MDAPEQWRAQFQREQHVRQSLRAAADRLESAEQERVVNIAAVVQLSPARVHQLLHAPVSAVAVCATAIR